MQAVESLNVECFIILMTNVLYRHTHTHTHTHTILHASSRTLICSPSTSVLCPRHPSIFFLSFNDKFLLESVLSYTCWETSVYVFSQTHIVHVCVCLSMQKCVKCISIKVIWFSTGSVCMWFTHVLSQWAGAVQYWSRSMVFITL